MHNPLMTSGTDPSSTSDKKMLRRHLRARRRSLVPQQDREADATAIAAAASTLLGTLVPPPSRTGEHPAYDQRHCVAIYRSLPGEPPTQALATMLHTRGWRVLVPEMLPDRDLDWHELRADGSEGPGLGLEAIADASVIVAPALSVDRTGTRLGQGGGSYDRALARRRPDAVLVAIINDGEYAARPLPREAHDIRMDAVITPAGGLVRISGRGSVS